MDSGAGDQSPDPVIDPVLHSDLEAVHAGFAQSDPAQIDHTLAIDLPPEIGIPIRVCRAQALIGEFRHGAGAGRPIHIRNDQPAAGAQGATDFRTDIGPGKPVPDVQRGDRIETSTLYGQRFGPRDQIPGKTGFRSRRLPVERDGPQVLPAQKPDPRSVPGAEVQHNMMRQQDVSIRKVLVQAGV